MATPGRGLVKQYRADTGAASATVSQRTGAASVFVRISTSTSFETGEIVSVRANYSPDGTLWHILGQAHVQMKPNSLIGIAVTSHDASVQTTATLDTVRSER